MSNDARRWAQRRVDDEAVTIRDDAPETVSYPKRRVRQLARPALPAAAAPRMRPMRPRPQRDAAPVSQTMVSPQHPGLQRESAGLFVVRTPVRTLVFSPSTERVPSPLRMEAAAPLESAAHLTFPPPAPTTARRRPPTREPSVWTSLVAPLFAALIMMLLAAAFAPRLGAVVRSAATHLHSTR